IESDFIFKKRCIKWNVEIVYQDKSGRISQRKIEVMGIRGDQIRATCLSTGVPRVFLAASFCLGNLSKEQRYA
ncbi:hypothetical protein, partial [Paenibacillus sp. Marseille-Q9583]